MKTKENLQEVVQKALKMDPQLLSANIESVVNDGTVTLYGTVNNYAKKVQAENVIKHIAGVKMVIEKIEVKFDSERAKNQDYNLAKNIANIYYWNCLLPNNCIHVKVKNGWITLDGETNWNYQREEAKNSIKDLVGIQGITNNIAIKWKVENEIDKMEIETAIKRNVSLENAEIKVGVKDHQVMLTGNVSSWHLKDEASRVAWSAPGVWSVVNQLAVIFEFDSVL